MPLIGIKTKWASALASHVVPLSLRHAKRRSNLLPDELLSLVRQEIASSLRVAQ
jgi:hypothetical protein